jgi:hypothetical protein
MGILPRILGGSSPRGVRAARLALLLALLPAACGRGSEPPAGQRGASPGASVSAARVSASVSAASVSAAAVSSLPLVRQCYDGCMESSQGKPIEPDELKKNCSHKCVRICSKACAVPRPELPYEQAMEECGRQCQHQLGLEH